MVEEEGAGGNVWAGAAGRGRGRRGGRGGGEGGQGGQEEGGGGEKSADSHDFDGIRLARELVDDGAIARCRDRLSSLPCCGEPCLAGLFELHEGLLRRCAKGRAGFEIWHVGDIPAVFLAVEDVDV